MTPSTMTASPPTGIRRYAASGSIALRELLTGPERTMVPVAAFPGAIHLGDPASGRIELAVVADQAVVHPHALVLAPRTHRWPFVGLHVGNELVVGRRRVRWQDRDVHEVEVTRWWSPRPALGDVDRAALTDANSSLAVLLARRCSDLPATEAERLDALVDALRAEDEGAATGAVRGLVGLGVGSTPTGDDLLAGLFAGVELFGSALPAREVERLIPFSRGVAAQALSWSETVTTALSAVLLRHAVRGEVCRPAGRLIVALARGLDRDALAEALDGLLAVGSTSGRDLAFGLRAASEVLSPGDVRDAPGDASRDTKGEASGDVPRDGTLAATSTSPIPTGRP